MALRVAVMGAGTMGHGIAQVLAQGGHGVTLRDLDPSILDRARAQIDRSLGKLVDKGRLPASDRAATLDRIAVTTDLAPVAGADLVIEAVAENLETKRALFAELDGLVPPAAILASNTSSISITKLG